MADPGPERTVRIADSPVMGRLPVLVLVTFMSVVGILQLIGVWGSKLLSEYGGRPLDTAWSITLIASGICAWAGRIHRSATQGAILETAAIAFVDLGLLTYLVTLWHANRFDGSGLVAFLCLASIANCTGRAFLLRRRMKELRKAVE